MSATGYATIRKNEKKRNLLLACGAQGAPSLLAEEKEELIFFPLSSLREKKLHSARSTTSDTSVHPRCSLTLSMYFKSIYPNSGRKRRATRPERHPNGEQRK